MARDRLAAAGIDSAARDAKILAGFAFGMDALDLARDEHRPVPQDRIEALEALILRRIAREPVARILGHKEFYGLDFGLNAATLVPRPETEQLVDLGIAHLKDLAAPRILDLGTGTGCIAISLLAHLPHAQAVATDISAKALAQAGINAQRHDVAERLDLREGSWFDPVSRDERFDLIVSNPPYIPHAEIAALDLEVRGHDPHMALDGGSDGFEPYRILAAKSPAHLSPSGIVLLEHGTGQWDTVESLFTASGAAHVTKYHDLAGHDRVALVNY